MLEQGKIPFAQIITDNEKIHEIAGKRGIFACRMTKFFWMCEK